ncbi:hypothetical protein OAG24_00265 [bacterium]|nr:hypothetical protein [bacterium]
MPVSIANTSKLDVEVSLNSIGEVPTRRNQITSQSKEAISIEGDSDAGVAQLKVWKKYGSAPCEHANLISVIPTNIKGSITLYDTGTCGIKASYLDSDLPSNFKTPEDRILQNNKKIGPLIWIVIVLIIILILFVLYK